MNKDEIYDHLAQVYLGKRRKEQDAHKKEFNAWLLINIFITVIIFASAFYGFSAFLVQKGSFLDRGVVFALHRGLVRMEYDFNNAGTPEKSFSLSIPSMDIAKYSKLHFAIRAREEGTPGIVKIVLRNKKNETAYFYVKNVGLSWQNVDIPLETFKDISDWTNLNEVSFVLESWNVEKNKGMVLIEDISFSS
jgi:hypothetical protein